MGVLVVKHVYNGDRQGGALLHLVCAIEKVRVFCKLLIHFLMAQDPVMA